MRFSVECMLEKKYLPINYRDIFFDFLKRSLDKYDYGFSQRLCENVSEAKRPCTFSIMLDDFEIKHDKLVLYSDIIFIKFSTISNEIGIEFYNAMSQLMNQVMDLGLDNTLRIVNVEILKERNLDSNEATFKTISPVFMKRVPENTLREFEDLQETEYINILKRDLYEKITESYHFPKEYIKRDIEDTKIDLLENTSISEENKLVNEIVMRVKARKYILEYIYKSGIGNNTSMGFGMLDIV